MNHAASLSAPQILAVSAQQGGQTSFGCNQDWYQTEWQRYTGCGPSVATNMLYYMLRRNGGMPELLAMMEEVWKYVTPTDRGIPTTELFYERFLDYAAAKGIDVVRCRVLNAFEEPRPSLDEIVRFLEEALAADLPVAFLNLCNGDEENLDKWHWVTLVSLEYGDDEPVWVTVFDNGEPKRANLTLWLATTTMGGGFVYFQFAPDKTSALDA